MTSTQQHNYGLVDTEEENRRRLVAQEYLDFLDDKDSNNIYAQKVEELIRRKDTRLIVNLNDIREKMAPRLDALFADFVTEIICFEKALRDVVIRSDPDFIKETELNIGFEGSFGERHVNPRSLKSQLLGKLVCCEGIVTRCSSVRPKVVKSVHYCPVTKKTLERKYTDFTSYDSFPSSNTYPKEDENKNPLETEFGLSVYKDHQVFSIQELPECSPPGQLPRSIDVIADDDLSDACKPGDRIQIVGLFRVLPNKQNASSTGNFRSIIIANNVILLSKENLPKFERQDIKFIGRLSKRPDVVDILARSLAPSIYGHEEVKKAVLCLLLGGSEKILANGSRLRGDINVLLIGDPSVAKSQILRYVLHTAPRVVATTGRGSSGVGLTAAVTTDPDTKERRLEAGAMVLADRGIVCIDEFDKMTDIDRTAIHEVMEQGRVSISKAGIHAKLNARCSVLAAANPVYGRYDLFKSPMANIGMQDSLLSRFDLIFVMLDEHQIDRDQQVADNVLKLHRYRTPGEADGTVLTFNSTVETLSTHVEEPQDTTGASDMYELNRGWTAVDERMPILNSTFLRKYIHMAKGINPKLSKEASSYITECYTELRSYENSDEDRTMPVTARQLETMIRLSIAMAKARMSTEVTRQDAEKAYTLLHFAMFKKKPKERMDNVKHRKKHDNEFDEEDELMETDANPAPSTRPSRRRRAQDDPMDSEDIATTSAPVAKRARGETAGISVDRYARFKEFLRVAFDMADDPEGMNPVSEIVAAIQRQAGRLTFSDGEIKAAIEFAEGENICMVSDDMITLI